MNGVFVFAAAAAILLSIPSEIYAQRGRGAQPPSTARAAAPADLTGYWVSIISEDWKFRMVTPPKGQYGNIPLSPAGRKVAESWDPSKDESASEQCKAYGAAGIMRMPTRLNITWENDNVLRIDTDAGTQTRLIHFGRTPPPAGPPSWQGSSNGQWQGGGRGGGGAPGGSLKVVTTNMRPGYLRKNGAPYSAGTVMTEYFESHAAPNGDRVLVVTAIIEDPQYLNSPYVTSTNFKKLAGNSGWNPTPCLTK